MLVRRFWLMVACVLTCAGCGDGDGAAECGTPETGPCDAGGTDASEDGGEADPCPASTAGDERMTQLAEWMDDRMQEHEIPGGVIAVVHGDDTFIATAGALRERGETCVTEDTRFAVGSVTQIFTSMAVLDAVEEGELALDEPIATYVGDSVSIATNEHGSADDITLHELLSFSSSLPHPGLMGLVGGCDATLASWFGATELEPRYPPGAFGAVGPVDAMLAGFVLQQATDEPFADAVQRRVFDPLGMDTASIGPPSGDAPVAYAHYRGAVPLGPEVFDCEASAPYMQGWLSPRDAAAALRMLADSDTTVVDEGHLAQLGNAAVQDGRYGTFRVGYGFFEFEYPSELGLGPVWSYRGGTAGFTSGMRYYPEQRFGTFFAYNATISEEWRGKVETYDKAAQLFLDPEVECYCRVNESCSVDERLNCRDPEPLVRETSEWTGYAGTYEPYAPGEPIEITVDGDSIELTSEGHSAAGVPVGLDSFTVRSGPLQDQLLHIVLDDTGTGAWLHRGTNDVFARQDGAP